jgi:hypothetical protein
MRRGNASVRRAMQSQGKQPVDRGNGSLGAVTIGLARPGSLEPSTIAGHHDPLYLFVCHVEWHQRRNLEAYQELVAALDDSDGSIRTIAEMMLHRSSPRPRRKRRDNFPR